MNVPTNLFMWIMACLPIIVLLLLMIKFQWGATEAAPVGLAITIITGIVFYKADIRLLAAESAKGIWSALIILLIVWTAILLYQVADEARAFLVIRNGMRKLLPNELLMVLALDTGELSPGNYRIRCTGGSGSSPAHGHWSSSRIRSHHTFIGAGMGQYLRYPGSCLGCPGHVHRTCARYA